MAGIQPAQAASPHPKTHEPLQLVMDGPFRLTIAFTPSTPPVRAVWLRETGDAT